MSETVEASGTRSTPGAESPADKVAVLADWSARLSAELGLDISVDIDAILSLAGVAAHTVIRPAAPLTTFLVGYAAGRAAAEADFGERLTNKEPADSEASSNAVVAIEVAMASARSLLRAATSDTALE
ncbi:MAG: hypothetical protein H7248_00610 [Microbacteriaceae bacterium]|nr:hypothetical protein [Microbacteriaceae bacterium]